MVEQKKNRVIEQIEHEWKYENLILIILALFALELGVLLLCKDLTISEEAPIIGEHWKIFAWILVGLGGVSIILAVSGFYKPSFAEIKHITGLSRKEFLSDIIIVIVFSAIVIALIMGFNALIELVLK